MSIKILKNRYLTRLRSLCSLLKGCITLCIHFVLTRKSSVNVHVLEDHRKKCTPTRRLSREAIKFQLHSEVIYEAGS